MKVYCVDCKLFWKCEKNTDECIKLLGKTNYEMSLEAVIIRQNKMAEMAGQCVGYS